MQSGEAAPEAASTAGCPRCLRSGAFLHRRSSSRTEQRRRCAAELDAFEAASGNATWRSAGLGGGPGNAWRSCSRPRRRSQMIYATNTVGSEVYGRALAVEPVYASRRTAGNLPAAAPDRDRRRRGNRAAGQMWRPRKSLLVWRSPASQRASSLCASARRIASISATSSGSWVNSTISPSGEAT